MVSIRSSLSILVNCDLTWEALPDCQVPIIDTQVGTLPDTMPPILAPQLVFMCEICAP